MKIEESKLLSQNYKNMQQYYNSAGMRFPEILIMMWMSTLILVTQQHKGCIHDQIIANQSMIFIDDTKQHQQKRRVLQSRSYGPIRIHYQYNTTTISDNDVIGKNLKKIMSIINQFWARTIEVDYLLSLSFQIPAGFDPTQFKCMSFTVPSRLIQSPLPNKDFGLLIQAEDDGDSGVTAYSYPCASSTVNKRPLWGFMHWNKQYLSFNPLNFQQNIHIGIHQILHVLGFSQMLYSNYQSSQQVFVSNNGNMYLNGPYLREEIMRQYGCSDAPGMALEMNGGSGTAMSHWSRKTASNQLMTAGVSVNNPTISYITLALLEQTGWYRKIYKNLGKFINFGYKKGCSMLSPTNCTSNQYCVVKDQKKPDYDRTALGYCKNDSLSNCMYIKFYVNFICTDPNYAQKSLHADQGIIAVTGQSGGMKSRCYASDLRTIGATPSKYNFRCYQTLCSPSKKTLTLRIGRSLAFCMFPNQVIKVGGFEGTLRCPDSFKAMCAIERCPSQCNANGICIAGKCLCDANFQGPACSQLSSLGTASKTNLFLPSQNNNCVAGSYRTVFGDCQPCEKGCARCDAEGCFHCLNDKLPVNGKCI